MIEHEIVMIIAAPLIAMARPFGAMFWALPSRARASVGVLTRRIRGSASWRIASTAWFATALQAAALWLWRVPALYNAVLASPALHRLQHFRLFFSALLFWWVLINPRAKPSGYGAAVLCLFVTAVHSSFLGVLLTLIAAGLVRATGGIGFANRSLPLEDQQLAGLVMWVRPGWSTPQPRSLSPPCSSPTASKRLWPEIAALRPWHLASSRRKLPYTEPTTRIIHSRRHPERLRWHYAR